jgi:hypothetical protein
MDDTLTQVGVAGVNDLGAYSFNLLCALPLDLLYFQSLGHARHHEYDYG